MSQKHYQVVVVELNNRKEQAPKVQEIFTLYGDCILTRQGVHDINDDLGVITLSVKADDEYMDEFSNKLMTIEGVRVKVVKTGV